MPRFQPSFSFWPRPQFLGGAKGGLEAWMTRRDEEMEETHDKARTDTIKQIIDEYHDRNGRTIHPARRNDV
jgi:hypothetical protein